MLNKVMEKTMLTERKFDVTMQDGKQVISIDVDNLSDLEAVELVADVQNIWVNRQDKV